MLNRKKDPDSKLVSQALAYLRAADREIAKMSSVHHHRLSYGETALAINKAIDWADDLRYVVKLRAHEQEDSDD